MTKNKDKIKMPFWLVCLGLFFSITVLAVSALRTKQVMAQVEETVKEEIVMEENAVDYYLPYPGILPDHPLYWLKMIRDRIQLWLVTGDLAKAEKYLLYADKRLGAGWALVDGNKVDLGIATLTKAEKYLEKAILTAAKLGKGKELIFKSRLEKATMKHQQVLLMLIEKLPDEFSGILKKTLEISQKGEEILETDNGIDLEVEEKIEGDEETDLDEALDADKIEEEGLEKTEEVLEGEAEELEKELDESIE